MNGKGGGCCIARYGGGGMYGMSKVDKIMLKYRPIAPKPVVAGSGAGSGGSSTENSGGYVKCERTKRKYVRVNKNKKKKETSSRKKFTVPPPTSPIEQEVVTLSLLPETPAQKQTSSAFGLVSPTTIKCNCSSNIITTKKSEPMWLDFNTEAQKLCLGHMKSVVPVFSKPIQPAPPQVVSYVTVECVTDTWVDIPGLGCTDEERVRNMEHDTCPSFISDGQDRVVWTNKAYRQMAAADSISVVLVRKDKRTLLPLTFPAFTCKVRVTSAVNSNRTTTTTLPCDLFLVDLYKWFWILVNSEARSYLANKRLKLGWDSSKLYITYKLDYGKQQDLMKETTEARLKVLNFTRCVRNSEFIKYRFYDNVSNSNSLVIQDSETGQVYERRRGCVGKFLIHLQYLSLQSPSTVDDLKHT
ncbi:hypothetical protein CTI12_AA335620 [Artemisia annua]|uniref:DUF7950 domain-containing protein n=1 Tax=Artemisia annua TaxID=35608 RepID=A0A2U1MVL7_ARTAN|nr:hypothetical protein CTI12_AA335620 [Artemisia annua]